MSHADHETVLAFRAADHNGYAKADRYYVSHYRRGLEIFDLANPEALREVARFDTFLSPAENVAGTDGAWGIYPFLPSGNILISDIDNGLFILRDRSHDPPDPVPPSAGGGGGGGGATDMLSLFLAGVVLGWSARRQIGARLS